MIVLGGGGYTIRNVSRAWAYETSVLCNVEIDKRLPFNEYYDYFGPDYTIEVKPTNMKNENTPKYLSYVTEKIFENLRNVVHVPSVQLIETPPALVEAEEEDLLWRNFVENKRDDGF
ncbi:Histone deacetylase 6 [Dictyocoela roeselum]|nr:Histone deacetylase 6 [Dictyocoela roeselum]